MNFLKRNWKNIVSRFKENPTKKSKEAKTINLYNQIEPNVPIPSFVNYRKKTVAKKRYKGSVNKPLCYDSITKCNIVYYYAVTDSKYICILHNPNTYSNWKFFIKSNIKDIPFREFKYYKSSIKYLRSIKTCELGDILYLNINGLFYDINGGGIAMDEYYNNNLIKLFYGK